MSEPIASRLLGRGSPFELCELVRNGVTYRAYAQTPATLADVFRRARAFGDRDFLIDYSSRLTFRQAIDRAMAIAAALRCQHHIEPSARIGIWGPNGLPWVVSLMAITLVNAVPVLIHDASTENEAIDALGMARCIAIVTTAERAQSLHRRSILLLTVILPDAPVDGPVDAVSAATGHPSHIHFESLLRPPTSDITWAQATDIDGEALVAFTSGSTGAPKGVSLTHRNVITGMMNMMLGGALTRLRQPRPANAAAVQAGPPRTLFTGALSHISGYGQLLLMSHLGGTLVIASRQQDEVPSLIARERVRSLSGVSVSFVRRLLCDADQRGALSSLQSVSIHGVALHAAIVTEVLDALPQVLVGTGYGMTETCGSVCVINGSELLTRPSSSGIVLPTVETRVLRPGTSADVTPGTWGELHLRGAMIMQGYCRADGTIEPLHEGWLPTGDLARIDADGYLYVSARVDGPVDTWPDQTVLARIEQRIARHSLVNDVVILRAPEFRNLLVFVVARPLAQDSARLESELQSVLANAQMRARLFLIDTLPRTAVGKVNRTALWQLAAAAAPNDS